MLVSEELESVTTSCRTYAIQRLRVREEVRDPCSALGSMRVDSVRALLGG